MKRSVVFLLVLAGLLAVLVWRWPVLPTINQTDAEKRYLDPIFDEVKVTKNLSYGSYQSSKLDLFEPQGDTLARRPVVVVIHGGGFTSGSKEVVAPFAQAFAQRGYVALAINYRLAKGKEFNINDPDLPVAIRNAQHDTQAAVGWARKNASQYRLDPEKIIVGGYSAGAMTALYVAISDAQKVAAAYSMSGMVLPGNFNAITDDDPPIIMLHGEKDMIVPYSMAVATQERIAAQGIINEFYSYPGVGHSIWSLANSHPRVYAFLYKYVIDQNQPLPSVSPQPSVSLQASASPAASASPQPSSSPSPSPQPSVSPSPQPSPSPNFPPSQPDTGTPTWLTVTLLLIVAVLTVTRVLLY